MLVLMVDVLEHVDGDVGLLRAYSRNLLADGKVLITVPACPFLWSGHEEFLGHLRRYTRRMLERMVRSTGLEVVRSRYFYGLVFSRSSGHAALRVAAPAGTAKRPAQALIPGQFTADGRP